MNSINYDHTQNVHTLEGPRAALPQILAIEKPTSILDVGCGIGTWLKVVLEYGISDVLGVDGVNIPESQLLIPKNFFVCHDLTKPLDLGRRFDLVLCLEVAEHLSESDGRNLIQSLTMHSDRIVFSAACPGQAGQGHVNCQWPGYWQQLFNDRGYVCDAELRRLLWDEQRLEVWYRQNIFLAKKDKAYASREPRIRPLIHPEIIPYFQQQSATDAFEEHVYQIEKGRMSVGWYLTVPMQGLFSKFVRRFRRVRGRPL
jgi:SAM-dependent methyltransferase